MQYIGKYLYKFSYSGSVLRAKKPPLIRRKTAAEAKKIYGGDLINFINIATEI
jgi:hypothetical protein